MCLTCTEAAEAARGSCTAADLIAFSSWSLDQQRIARAALHDEIDEQQGIIEGEATRWMEGRYDSVYADIGEAMKLAKHAAEHLSISRDPGRPRAERVASFQIVQDTMDQLIEHLDGVPDSL